MRRLTRVRRWLAVLSAPVLSMNVGRFCSEGSHLGAHQGTGPARLVEKGVLWLLAGSSKALSLSLWLERGVVKPRQGVREGAKR